MNVPSGYTPIGVIGFTDKGVYDPNENYVINDIVHFGGNLWKCKIDDTTGITPVEGANWTIYLSEPTSAAEDIIAPVEPSATSTHIYTVGKQLILADVLYDVIDPINIGDALVVGTNISVANTIVEQLADKADSADLATVATTGAYSDLSGNPTLGTAAAKNVPASGDASTTEVVMGNDTRLTNARNAADVSAWAKAANKPTYNGSEIATSAAKTGTAQQSISDTVASGTSMDNVVGTMLDNDKTLDTNITSLKETFTNNGAHNLYASNMPTITKASITATAQSDGSYSFNGTASELSDFYFSTLSGGSTVAQYQDIPAGSYKLNGISGGSQSTYRLYLALYNKTTGTLTFVGGNDGDIDVEIGENISVSVFLRVYANAVLNNIVIKPMLRLASDTDTTYTPYTKTNQQLTKETTGLIDNDFSNGAVNMLPNTGESQVISGVTFTVNDDGTIIVNGMNETDVSINIAKTGSFELLPGRYKLSGSPTGGSTSTYRLRLRIITNDGEVGFYDTGDGCEVTLTKEQLVSGKSTFKGYVVILIYKRYTASNLLFKPMLTLADIPNSDYAHYVPYVMTNRQLTDVAAQVIDNYTYVNQINVVIITADGVKTIAELLVELRNAAIDYQANHPDEFIEYYLISIDTNWLEASNVTFGVLRDSSYTGRLYFTGISSGTVSNNDTFMITQVRLDSTLSGCKYLRCYTYDNSIVDLGSNVLASGKTIRLNGKIYKKIN